MAYSAGAMERAMKVQEVILRALSGQLTWVQAADILGRSPRSIRRLRWRFEHRGYDGLLDHRRQTPSPKRAPVAEVERMLRLYRERYRDFNVRHFLAIARRQHQVTFCYAFVKKALQGGPGWCPSSGRAGATGVVASRGPALVNCSTSTVVATSGWRWCPSSGSASS